MDRVQQNKHPLLLVPGLTSLFPDIMQPMRVMQSVTLMT